MKSNPKKIHKVGDITNNWYTKQEVYAGRGYYSMNNQIVNDPDCDMIIMADVINNMTPRYSCLRPPGAAGAAVINKNHWIVYGDVKPADGSPTCKDLGECMIEDGHCVRTIHAEVRAIMNAAKYHIAVDGGTIYSILKPCFQCTKVIVTAGITRIVYAGIAYDEERTKQLLENAPQKIEIVQLNDMIPYAKELRGE